MMLSRRNVDQAHAGSAHGELPFVQLWQLLEGLRLGPNLQKRGTKSSGILNSHDIQRPSATFDELSSRGMATKDLTTMHEHTVGPVLSSLLPQSHLEILPNSTACLTKADHLSTAYLKLLVYAATNNFAGVEHLITLPMMYDYLRPMVAKFLEMNVAEPGSQRFGTASPSLKPMVETFFRCVIEAGDAVALKDLCSCKALGINVNEQVVTVKGRRYTPLERAAKRGFFETTKILISMGADVNKSFVERVSHLSDPDEVLDFNALERGPSGPLEYIVQRRRELRPAENQIFHHLLRAGASIAMERLIPPIKEGHLDRVGHIVIHRMELDHIEWTIKGLFHRLIQVMNDSACIALIRQMVAVGVDLNHTVSVGCTRPFWVVPKHPPNMIDAAIERGNVDLVEEMILNGATFTADSLTAAVRSQSFDIVYNLLKRCGEPNHFSVHFRSTPYAEAIRLGNPDLTELLIEAGCQTDQCDSRALAATIVAAAEVGDVGIVRQLIPLMCEDADAIGYALLKAVESADESISEILLEAGANTGKLRDLTVFRMVPFASTHRYLEFHPDYGSNAEQESSPEPALEVAIEQGNCILFKMLIDHDAPLENALSTAIRLGQCWMIQQLIPLYSPSRYMDLQLNPLALAVRKGDLQTVKLLAGADCFFEGALLEAIGLSSDHMVHELIQLGAVPDWRVMKSALDQSSQMFRLLWDTFQHVFHWSSGAYLLNQAIRDQKSDIVRILLEWDSRIVTGKARVTVSAAMNMHLQFPDLKARSVIELSPLATAILSNDDPANQILGMLIQAGLALDDTVWRESHRCRFDDALLTAITTKIPGIVALLIQHGANVNPLPRLKFKRTPLQKAAEVGSVCIVWLLLQGGADPNGEPSARGGGTALQFAAIGGFIGIFGLLLEHGADPSAPCSKVNGRMPLEGAAEHGRFDMVTYILQMGARPQPEVDKAVKLARENGHSAIADVLEQHAPQNTILHIAEISNEPHMCGVCHVTLSNASARARHEGTVHGNGYTKAKHSCEICGRTFGRKDLSERHKATHSKQGYVGCDVCGKQFRKDYLKTHLPGCQKRISCDLMV